MKISIITPTNNPVFLGELEQTIMAQSHTDWEWIVLLNQGAQYVSSDKRIKVIDCPFHSTSIGFLKRLACLQATGDVIAEVDHDDLITKNCLAKLSKAFGEDEGVGFVFSQNAKLGDNFRPYLAEFGWSHYMYNWQGKQIYAMRNQPVTPGRLGHIYWAPDHIRAWRRDVYESIGGHNDTLRLCDDLDLMHRLYLVTRFKEIEEVLYIYRMAGQNTYSKNGRAIEDLNRTLYDRNIEKLSRRFAELNGLDVVDLWEGTDLRAMRDSSVGLFIAKDVLQYFEDRVGLMNEIHRVLAVGGMLLAEVPGTEGSGGFADPTAKSYWNQLAFYYFTKREFAAKIGGRVLFRDSKCSTGFRDEISKDLNMATVTAHLEKII